MKQCPYCMEEIQDDAVRCIHCKSLLNSSNEKKISSQISRPKSATVVAVLSVFHGICGVGFFMFIMIMSINNREVNSGGNIVLFLLLIAFSVLLAIAGFGALKLLPWSRYTLIVLSVIWILFTLAVHNAMGDRARGITFIILYHIIVLIILNRKEVKHAFMMKKNIISQQT